MDVLYKMRREMLRRGMSHKTITTYVQCVKQFMRKYPHLRSVTKKSVREYLSDLAESGAAGSSLNVHHSAIKYVLTQILNRRMTFDLKFCRKPERLPVILSKQEVMSIINAVENLKHRLVIELMYSAGLRVGEVVKLRSEDIDLSRNIGWVRKGKGGKDRPFILAEKIRKRLEHVLKDGSGFLFPGRHAHLTVRTVQEIIKKAVKKIGLKKCVHPHVFRHSFATHLIEDGYDPVTVQPLLGHSDVSTTMIYLHTADLGIVKVRSPYDAPVLSRNYFPTVS